LDSDALARRLRRRLDPDLLRRFGTLPGPVEEAAYDEVFDRVVEGLKVEEE